MKMMVEVVGPKGTAHQPAPGDGCHDRQADAERILRRRGRRAGSHCQRSAYSRRAAGRFTRAGANEGRPTYLMNGCRLRLCPLTFHHEVNDFITEPAFTSFGSQEIMPVRFP